MKAVTESVAKTEGCPFARVYKNTTYMSAAVNRTPGGTYDSGAMCQGSKCRAWMWATAEKKEGDCRLLVNGGG